MSYNLDDVDGAQSIPFTLNGNQYRLRYPTTDEALALGKLQSVENAQDAEGTMAEIYKFVTPVNEGTPSIKEALGGSSVKKLQKFMDMIKAEFAVGE